MTKVFSQTKLASHTYSANFDEFTYFERTKRNHYWLGGIESQKKLKDLRVGVTGLGGMGSNLAEIMVRLGVGHIKIADPDVIENSNLNRQVIANKNTVGMKKAHASALELRNICEDFELVVYDDGITEKNAEEFVSDLDAIIDEIDVFPFRPHVWLHQAARKLNLPLYTGYIIGLGTHVYKFQGNDYTFEDFMLNQAQEIDAPSSSFMMDRLFNPPPSYMSKEKEQRAFAKTIEDKTVPIFGASTYASQSLIAVRLITDFLKLDEKWGGPKTPVMPKFLKLDPFELSLRICDISAAKPLAMASSDS